MTDAAESCPCGSGAPYRDCCQPCHLGEAAATPEALMRSRYSAFCLGLGDYLLASWHPSTRPRHLDLAGSPRWVALELYSASESGDRGSVHFRAIHRTRDDWAYLEEQSDFLREAGRWYYLAGKTRQGRLKPGRNDPCPCGSGRKVKACGCQP